ncbi:hypothetical protein BDZ91DRAFT_77886 [Kalaharituber pfeilii]|nr:hypothetical protein BDZ91DRAFT_77886 [Kalaharituber pfeilii]
MLEIYFRACGEAFWLVATGNYGVRGWPSLEPIGVGVHGVISSFLFFPFVHLDFILRARFGHFPSFFLSLRSQGISCFVFFLLIFHAHTNIVLVRHSFFKQWRLVKEYYVVHN